MSGNSPRIAAVVVTFNRKALLVECLDALLGQTMPLNKIFLIDNASSDGTPEYLRRGGYLDNDMIDYVRLGSNTGGAGGFHEGVKRAYEAGYDWIWLMDDDAEPERSALQLAFPYLRGEYAAVANLKVGVDGIPQYHHRGWFSQNPVSRSLIEPISDADLDSDIVNIDHASFVGLFVSRSAVKGIGFPRKEFFIHLDDVDYCVRLRRFGKIGLVPASIIKHKDAGSVTPVREGNFLSRFRGAPYKSLWIHYYGLRNKIIVKSELFYGISYYYFIVSEFLAVSVGSVKILLADDHKIRRLAFRWSAFSDGIRGVFDNEKPKHILDGRK